MTHTSEEALSSLPTRRILVGTSGFSYPEWRGKFYPKELPPKKFLSYYAQHFSTTEINNTFYRIPTPQLVQGWYKEVPERFLFTLKLSQEITHRKKLKDVDDQMRRFLEGAAAMKEKLATLLVQLPPFFRKDTGTLGDFLVKFSQKARLALEFRHDSWFSDDVFELLRTHQSALAVVEKEEGEGAGAARQVTGPFIYMRLRKGEYSKPELLDWARWIRAQTADVFCYMKHDEEAPLLANRLLGALNEL
jgi:uncharacterized protein YecE (DUF72 family)